MSDHTSRLACGLAIATVALLAGAAAAEGDLTTLLDGSSSWRVKVSWASPLIESDDEPKEFRISRGRSGMIQSPEGVGLYYGVPLYSDKHWALIDRSFRWIAVVGSKVVFLPLTAETEYGNGQSMVLWTKTADRLAPDFSRVEKYLDLAVKHLGRPRFVTAGV